jgi:hypothetical protein
MATPLVEDKKTWGSGGLFGNRALGSLLLVLITPTMLLTLWSCCKHHSGSLLAMYTFGREKGLPALMSDIYQTPLDPFSLRVIFSFMVSHF